MAKKKVETSEAVETERVLPAGEIKTGNETKVEFVEDEIEIGDADSERAETTEAEQNNELRIKFVGRRKLESGDWEDLDAPKEVNSGNRKIKLPDSETQKAGFILPAGEASILLREYPQYYKRFTEKGN